MTDAGLADPDWIPLRLLRLADALGAGLTAQGRDGRTVWANDRAAALLGVTVADLLGSSSRELRWQSVDANREPLAPDEHPAMIALSRGAAVTGFVMGMSAAEEPGEDPGLTWFVVDSEPIAPTTGPTDGAPIGVVSLFIPAGDAAAAPERHHDVTSLSRASFLLEKGHDGFSIHSETGRYLYVSESFTRITGWSPDDILGKDAYTMFHPDDVPDVEASHSTVAATGTSVVRYRLRCADGTWLPVETLSQVQTTGSGVVQVLCLTRDVSSEETAEELAELVISESPVGLAILATDGTIVRANRAFATLLHRGPDDLVDSPYLPLTLPDDIPSETELWTELHNGALDRFEIKKRFLLPGGGWFWSAISVVALPRREDGQRLALLQATDIDERERVMAQLRASELRMRTALESLPTGMLLLSELGTVAFANSAASPGGFSKDLIGKEILACYSWLSGEHRDRLAQAIRSRSSLTQPARLTMVVAGRTRLFQLNLVDLGARATPEVSFIAHLQEQPLATETTADIIERSARDGLTGLLTRAEFHSLAEQAVRNAAASGRSVGLLFCDLEGFKRINDTYGHATGDAVLAAVGQAIRGGTRQQDVAARFGGDEFVLLVPADRLADLEALGAKLSDRIVAATEQWGGIGMTFGAALSGPESTVDGLVRAADTDMYGKRAR